ncbi:unnamed protein product [Orchesella dallaii]|uniref:Uncharacterized protein n=1 Tax=Orchesella dallaii TaxID=48710 RepID=A0ABP1RX51_9HEXA
MDAQVTMTNCQVSSGDELMNNYNELATTVLQGKREMVLLRKPFVESKSPKLLLNFTHRNRRTKTLAIAVSSSVDFCVVWNIDATPSSNVPTVERY